MTVGAGGVGGVGVGDDVGDGGTVGTGVAVGSGTAVGTGVCVGVGLSVGAWVAAGGASVAGSGVADGEAVAVAGTAVAAAGAACSPPQAARAMTAVRQSIKTVEISPVPVGLTQNAFMAPFSAPGTVASMIRPAYPPGVRFESGGLPRPCRQACDSVSAGGSAAGARPTQRQRGLPVRDLGTVGGRDPLNPPVTSTGQNTGCANCIFSVQRPFPVCQSLPRTTWVQGLFPRRNQDKS